MPKAKPAAKPKTAEKAEDFDEQIVVADLNGVMDPAAVRRAVAQNAVALRFANTDQPMVQVGQAVFAAEWTQTVGTDLVFRPAPGPEPDFELLAASFTRLRSHKAIISSEQDQ